MLRVESEDGWWLITHADHARLAAEFAACWGNDLFATPEPRTPVLYGIGAHDAGWIACDNTPTIARDGTPSAFSHELMNTCFAFEKSLPEYLALRERALHSMEIAYPYAALLVSMHSSNLFTAHFDRSTVVPEQLPMLDEFLDRQRNRAERLRTEIRRNPRFPPRTVTEQAVLDNFRLLQATDYLSLLSCIGCMHSSTLLHPLRRIDGSASPIHVHPQGPRRILLKPYPLNKPVLTFEVPVRHIRGKRFQCSQELAEAFHAAPPEPLRITITASP